MAMAKLQLETRRIKNTRHQKLHYQYKVTQNRQTPMYST